jgi:hypothetical protein
MERAVMETDDLFLAALGLLRGGELVAVDVRGMNGRRIAVFRIGGLGVEDAERDFHRGPTLVDLRLLKSEVRRLKDTAFDAIREEERRAHASEQGGYRAHPSRESHRGRRR